MSQAGHICRRIGNELYKAAFPIYRPLYRLFKTYGDRVERQLLGTLLTPGCVVVDAGANIGIYSQFFSELVGPSGAVHSFEPSPENFAHLRDTVANRPNVRVNQLALSDKTEQSVLYVSEHLNVDHRVYRTEGEARRTIAIRSTKLDDYFEHRAPIDLIKMDIQGHELHALKGAEEVLADNPNILLLLEFWPYGLKQAGYSGDELLAFLRERDFSLFVPQTNGLTRCERPAVDDSDETSYCNVFAQRR